MWSPFSNLWLYGDTTDVSSARRHGLRVCLGSDWTPSGTRNLLGELKVATRGTGSRSAARSIRPTSSSSRPRIRATRSRGRGAYRSVDSSRARSPTSRASPTRARPVARGARGDRAARPPRHRRRPSGVRQPTRCSRAPAWRTPSRSPSPASGARIVMDLPDELLPTDPDLRAEATKSWRAGLAELDRRVARSGRRGAQRPRVHARSASSRCVRPRPARTRRRAKRARARPTTSSISSRCRRSTASATTRPGSTGAAVVPAPRRDPCRPRRRVLTDVGDGALSRQPRASIRSVSASRRASVRSMLIAMCGSSCSSWSKSGRLIARHLSGVAARTRPVCTSPSTSSDSSPMNSPAHALDRPGADLDRHRAVLEDEQSRRLLARRRSARDRSDLERRRDGRDVRQREVVEIGEQRLSWRNESMSSGSPKSRPRMYRRPSAPAASSSLAVLGEGDVAQLVEPLRAPCSASRSSRMSTGVDRAARRPAVRSARPGSVHISSWAPAASARCARSSRVLATKTIVARRALGAIRPVVRVEAPPDRHGSRRHPTRSAVRATDHDRRFAHFGAPSALTAAMARESGVPTPPHRSWSFESSERNPAWTEVAEVGESVARGTAAAHVRMSSTLSRVARSVRTRAYGERAATGRRARRPLAGPVLGSCACCWSPRPSIASGRATIGCHQATVDDVPAATCGDPAKELTIGGPVAELHAVHVVRGRGRRGHRSRVDHRAAVRGDWESGAFLVGFQLFVRTLTGRRLAPFFALLATFVLWGIDPGGGAACSTSTRWASGCRSRRCSPPPSRCSSGGRCCGTPTRAADGGC